MKRIQEFILCERLTPIHAGYEISARTRWPRLARFLWGALRRLDALEDRFVDRYEVVRLPPPPDLFENIWKQIDGLYGTRRKPKEILIGPETLSEILSRPELAHCYHEIRAEGQGYYSGVPFPVPIRLIPQMEGVLVI